MATIDHMPLTSTKDKCPHCNKKAEWILRVGSGDWSVACSQHYQQAIERSADTTNLNMIERRAIRKARPPKKPAQPKYVIWGGSRW